MNLVRGGTHARKGCTMAVTLGLVHHWARRQVSPTSIAFGESSSYCFGAFSYCTVGAFWAIFPIFWGFVGIFWGTPATYFADFGAILVIFDHFWALLGPFLGRIKFWLFLPKNGGPEISAES